MLLSLNRHNIVTTIYIYGLSSFHPDGRENERNIRNDSKHNVGSGPLRALGTATEPFSLNLGNNIFVAFPI